MDKSTLLLSAIVLAVFGTSVAAGRPSWGIFTGLAIILLAVGLAAGALPMRSDDYFDERAGAGQRISRSLVTLSSTAIMAIYAAGYYRTSAAAHKFDSQTDGRENRRGGCASAAARAGKSAGSGGAAWQFVLYTYGEEECPQAGCRESQVRFCLHGARANRQRQPPEPARMRQPRQPRACKPNTKTACFLGGAVAATAISRPRFRFRTVRLLRRRLRNA